jgi:putative membrane protein
MRMLLFAGAAGVALLVALLLWYGIQDIATAVASAGWGLALVVIARIVQMIAAGIAWQMVLPNEKSPSAWIFSLLRWIRESINNLLPVAQIGGDFVGARLLASFGLSGSLAGASVLVDMLVQVSTQLLFTAVGIAVLANFDASSNVLQTAITGLFILTPGIFGFFLMQQFGGFGWIERQLLPIARRWNWLPAAQVGELDVCLQALLKTRGKLAAAAFIHLATWFFGASEIWIALNFMGHPATYSEALVIESLGQAIRAAAFVVPAGIGVQEGGYIALCSVFGLSPPVAIAVSLVKRVAELILGLPGLLAWHFMERRLVLQRSR